MSLKAFLEITPKEFYISLKSKSKYDGAFIESNIKWICNTIRTQTLYLYNPIVDKKSRKNDPKKLMNFPWDKESFQKPQTRDQMKRVMKAIVSSYQKKPKKEKDE